MKKVLGKIFFFLFLFVSELPVSAQTDSLPNKEEIGNFSISGSVDTYFHTTFGTVEKAPNTSFANLPGFSLGMINLITSYTAKKSGFVADFFYGPRGSDAVFNAPSYRNSAGGGSSQLINQMYVYYNINKKIKLSLGQFNAFLGYEYISPAPNFHYSTTYLFSNEPSNHTGLLADLDIGKGWSSKLAVANACDYTEFNPAGTYTAAGQLGYANDEGNIYLNVIYGDQDGKLKDRDTLVNSSAGITFLIDLSAGWNISKKYFLGFNTSYHNTPAGEIRTVNGIVSAPAYDKGFYGLALYQQLTFTDAFALGLRAEYFSEYNEGSGAIGAYTKNGDASIIDITLSGNLISDNFRIIPEIRIDMASENTFTAKTTGKSIPNMMSFNLAVVYVLPPINHSIHAKK